MSIHGLNKEAVGHSSLPEFPRSTTSAPPSLSSTPITSSSSFSGSSRITSIGKHFSRLMGSINRDRGSKNLSPSPSSSSISFILPNDESSKSERIVMGSKENDETPRTLANNKETEKTQKNESGAMKRVESEEGIRRQASARNLSPRGATSPRDNNWKERGPITTKTEGETNKEGSDATKIEKKNKSEKDNKEAKPASAPLDSPTPPRDQSRNAVLKERSIFNKFYLLSLL